jgi:hypothetical protein
LKLLHKYDFYGGQRGCAPPKPTQAFNFPNRPNATFEKACELKAIPNAISPAVGIAAMWCSVHRDEITGSAVAFVRRTFGLSVLEAVKALQAAHALKYRARGQ